MQIELSSYELALVCDALDVALANTIEYGETIEFAELLHKLEGSTDVTTGCAVRAS